MAYFLGWLVVAMGLGGTCGYLDPLNAAGSMPLTVTGAIGAVTNAAVIGLLYQSLPPEAERRLWIAGITGAVLALILIVVNWWVGGTVAEGVCRADVGFVTGISFVWVPVGSIIGLGLGIAGLGALATYGLTPGDTVYFDGNVPTQEGISSGTLILGLVTAIVAVVWGRTFPQRR
ncbi:MAG: hypothetical protein AAGA48_12785 [Myxococcota bacterium]